MEPNLVFSGKIGSGKSSVSKAVATAENAGWNSFGSTVKRIAVERGLPTSRQSLQQLGEELVATQPEKLCSRVFEEAHSGSGTPVVIDGLRHAHMSDLLKSCSHPIPMLCIYVDVAEDVRTRRLMDRDALTMEQIHELDRHSTEVQVGHEVRQIADFVVDNSNGLSETVQSVLSFLDSYQK